ncbi:MAG: PASTA domain-containing protein [Lutibacter sp.]|uniref:PASTA domain-containing protein n=1 Tax=Lutibacter sp. TaxID=1925666 RepID=UPI00299E01AD|nr:PASTA domain-containing protein [Lutibacter sp.]MDX1829880.1 PASTA domain-containing protein [Lutibacter sp.]
MNFINFLKSKVFFTQLIIAAVGLIIVFYALAKWLNISTHHNQKIEVPDLKKMSLVKVKQALDEVDLKMVVLDSASYNPNYPINSVIDQSPEAGDFVKENRKIYLTLNPSGYKSIPMPDLYGKTKRQATAHLLALGFKVSSNEIRVSDIAKDVVRGLRFNGKELKPGEKIPKNSVITLKLGDGKGSGSYKRNFE